MKINNKKKNKKDFNIYNLEIYIIFKFLARKKVKRKFFKNFN